MDWPHQQQRLSVSAQQLIALGMESRLQRCNGSARAHGAALRETLAWHVRQGGPDGAPTFQTLPGQPGLQDGGC